MRAYGDAKVCGIRLGMHARRLGGAVIHYHTTPSCLSTCVESSFFSYPCRKNQKDPSLFSNSICTFHGKTPVRFLELPEQLEGPTHGNNLTCLFISLY